jgi:cation transporter-like permease
MASASSDDCPQQAREAPLLRTTFWLLRLVALLTALSVTAVAISVALVAARTSVQLGMDSDTENKSLD